MNGITRSAGLKAEKRHRLVEAAIAEFNEYGLEKASYNRIIERSGLSKGSVYYYFENKDALLGIVMEEIGERVLDAVPEKPLPETRGDYWRVMWDYRRREFEFFAGNVQLGRVLIMSLEPVSRIGTCDVEKAYPPLARLVRRQKELIRRGQELGAVRSDMSEDMIFDIMRTIDQTLCRYFFGRDVDFDNMSYAERAKRSREYTRLFKDFIRRLLEPDASINLINIGEETINNVEKIAVSA